MDTSMVMSLFAPPEIMSAKKVLCVQPHADDNEIGMGGIVAVLTAKGIQVDYLTVTDGSLGAYVPALSGDTLIAVRQSEVEKAGAILGVNAYHYLNKADGTLTDIPALAGEIAEIMRAGQYDFVCCPDPWLMYEAHQDHIVTGKAVAQAFISVNLLEYPKGSTTAAYTPTGLGFYFTSKPNTVIDISNTFERKFAAMEQHQSQLNEQLLGLYRVYFNMKGIQLANDKDFPLGEGLKLMNGLHLHCFAEGETI
ncbi:MAG: PIG-L deacetylase family protein [Faecalibacterium sp.]